VWKALKHTFKKFTYSKFIQMLILFLSWPAQKQQLWKPGVVYSSFLSESKYLLKTRTRKVSSFPLWRRTTSQCTERAIGKYTSRNCWCTSNNRVNEDQGRTSVAACPGILPNTLLTIKLVVIPEISKDEFEQWDNEEEAEKEEKHHAHGLKGNTCKFREI